MECDLVDLWRRFQEYQRAADAASARLQRRGSASNPFQCQMLQTAEEFRAWWSKISADPARRARWLRRLELGFDEERRRIGEMIDRAILCRAAEGDSTVGEASAA